MTGQDTGLGDIRREIDAIDDGIVDLLVRRAAAQAKVKAHKQAAGSLSQSPVRPAREAEILRRVVKRAKGHAAPEFLVCLWRQILVASTLSQAKVKVHTTRPVVASEDLLRIVSGYFGTMPLAVHADEASALAALAGSRGDLGVFKTEGSWAECFATRGAGGAVIAGVLPVLASGGVPPLLLAGHAEAQASGDDCTLLITRHAPSGNVRWSAAAGDSFIICLEGFLGDAELAACGYPLSAEVIVAGRFPDQIKV